MAGWLISTALYVQLPSPSFPALLYANQLQDDLKLTLAKAITSARTSLWLSVYGITDPEMIALLAERSAEGIATQIRYDPNASLDLQEIFPKEALPIRKGGLMHRKAVVVDQQRVFLGSANLTPQSLRLHANLIIGLYSPPLATFLEQASEGVCQFEGGELWLLPDLGGRALERLLSAIGQAKKTLYLAIFTLTHPKLIDALIEAKSRGVEVEIALDRFAAAGASKKSAEKLREAGIVTRESLGKELLHHKLVWIDEKLLVMGSANWTLGAFESNEDYLLFLDPSPPKMERLWKAIRLETSPSL